MTYELKQTFNGVTEFIAELPWAACQAEATRLSFIWDGMASFTCTLAGVWA